VDEWAGARGRSDVFAQVADSAYAARHIRTTPFVPAEELRAMLERASGIVAHAGMGTILTALELGRPLCVMPRLGRLAETRNDHQVAAARHFSRTGLLLAAESEAELPECLDRLEAFSPGERIAARASAPLITRVRDFALGAV
jgi:UDP-N-acetylglucosamine transferase subunit ALG13